MRPPLRHWLSLSFGFGILLLGLVGCGPARETGQLTALETELTSLADELREMRGELAAAALRHQTQMREFDNRLSTTSDQLLQLTKAASAPPSDPLPKLLEALKPIQQLDRLKQLDRLDRLEQDVAALGEPVPTTLTGAEEVELIRIETFLDGALDNSPSADDIEKRRIAFAALCDAMSTSVRESHFDRLASTNWKVLVLVFLHGDPDSPDDLDGTIEEGELLRASSESDQTDGRWLKAVTDKLDELRRQARVAQVQRDVEAAKQLAMQVEDLLQNPSTEVEKLRVTLREIASFLDDMDAWGEQTPIALTNETEELEVLGECLTVEIVNRDTARKFSQARKIDDRVERETAVRQLIQNLVTTSSATRMEGKLQGGSQLSRADELRRALTTFLEDEVQRTVDEEEAQRTAYEKMALERIQNVREHLMPESVEAGLEHAVAQIRSYEKGQWKDLVRLPQLRKWLEQQHHIETPNFEITDDSARRLRNLYYDRGGSPLILRQAAVEVMTTQLLPLDTRYFSEPTVWLYQETWSKLWSSLEDDSDGSRLSPFKLEVAAASLTVKKLVPDESKP